MSVNIGDTDPIKDGAGAQVPKCLPEGYNPPEINLVGNALQFIKDKLGPGFGNWWLKTCDVGELPCEPVGYVFCTRKDVSGWGESYENGWTLCYQKGVSSRAPMCVKGTRIPPNTMCANGDRPKLCLPGWTYNEEGYRCDPTPFSPWQQRQMYCNTPSGRVLGYGTAIGCIPTDDLRELIVFIFRWVVGAVGGIMVLYVIVIGYKLLFSGGNPEALKTVKEQIVSLICGLILVIFSFVLLNVLGTDVLQLLPFIN